MARITRRDQPGPESKVYERLKYAVEELGLELSDIGVEEESEITASDLSKIFKDLKNVNSDYILSGTGPAINTTIRSRKLKDYTGINARVKRIRLRSDLTQAEFGKKIGYARATIAAIEQDYQTISFAALRKISDKFNVSYDYLIDGIESSGNVAQLQALLDECRKNNQALRAALINQTGS
jgi:transcriptional regulator with XRE-family HTH domain